MNLSDSLTVSYPDTCLQDVLSTWMLIAARSAEDAAAASPPEQTRSLHVLLTQLCAQTEPSQWESVAAAIYMGFAEASTNRVYETLLYELWQTMARAGGQWDIAARLWPLRSWVEDSLRAVIRGISDGEPRQARIAIDRHLSGVAAAAAA